MASTIQTWSEDARQADFLKAARDEPMSGRVRYAAAMHFHQRGLLSEESLEVYRMCSVVDHEDPRPVLEGLGLARELEAIERTLKDSTPAPDVGASALVPEISNTRGAS